MSNKIEQYHPDELPTKITRNAYFYYEVEGHWAGQIRIWGQDMHGQERLLLAKKPVTISIPKDIDLKGKMVEALQAEKQRILADTHIKTEAIQKKIDELLFLEYKPQKVANGSDDTNVIPFE
jgi:hypothetical protein